MVSIPFRKVGWILVAMVGVVSMVAGAVASGGSHAPAVESKPELGPVTFTPPSGGYRTNLMVALEAPAHSQGIHYTLDGSEPSEQSPRYTEPLAITNSILIKAKSIQPGKTSPTRSATYILLDDSLADFTSNLPLVILNTFGQEIPRETKVEASIQVIDPGQGRASFAEPVSLASQALVNIRGHTSLRYPKRSFQVKLRDGDNQPSKSVVLGLPSNSDWILYAPYSDKTLLRDVLAYELSNQMGRYAPHTRFVEVFANKTGGKLALRHYLGVYVFEEKIKRGDDRVAIAKLAPEDTTEPGISGGYIFKKDHLDHGDQGPPNIGGFPNGGSGSTGLREGLPSGPGGFPGDPRGFFPTQGRAEKNEVGMIVGSDRSPPGGVGFNSPQGTTLLYVDPEASEITPVQRRWLSQYIRKLEAALYGPEFRDPVKGYAAYLDADSFIDHHWLVEATKNIDGFRFSTFFHKDRGGKMAMGPIWDWNLSFGAPNGKQGYLPDHWYWPQLDDQQYSWFRRLFEDPEFAQKYVDRWGELRTNQLAAERIVARIDELSTLLTEAQTRNFKRWKILGRQVWPNYYTGKSYADEVQYLKKWVAQRLAWIDRQFVAGPTVTLAGAAEGRAAKMSLEAPLGKIYYTLDGSDPRLPGGGVSRGAQLYRGPIPLAAGVQVTARALEGKRWSWRSTHRGSAP